MSWRDRAACRSEDPELFFPVGGRDSLTNLALAICQPCPVLGECRREALETPIQDGIWGGMTEAARDELLRTRTAVSA
ncbi:WhiB family transcriptional regulator [Solihabitans fulvus]|uniref:Transcriptional regulator WhiB n=1 Tax=Solihabitans fulvus TaxID=1892852 RepID=A0A5B2WCR8_9PSEU|nr:WhiB family transcriptional regulator [Solihabitans fulvus]KAA2248688.1 WhiB family transcriptional regulator [Solihabitans fulvus]